MGNIFVIRCVESVVYLFSYRKIVLLLCEDDLGGILRRRYPVKV